MRVGIVLHGPSDIPTGVPRSSIELLAALCDLPDGPEIFLLGDEPLGGLESRDHPPTRIPLPPLTAKAFRAVRRVLGLRASHLMVIAAWLPRVARQYQLDVIHDFTGLVPFPRRLKKTHAVATIHDLVSHRKKSTNDFVDDLLQRRWLPYSLRQVDAVVTVSETVADEARAIFKLGTIPVMAVYHGVDHAVALVHDPGAPQPPSTPYLLAVGVTSERKNLQAVIRAGRDGWLSGELPPLLLVGPPGPVVTRALETAEQLGIRQHVTAVGYLPDAALQSYYGQATALVYPSLDEGFGLPIVEAMSYGTPVITSARGATQEIAGDAALLVDPFDDDSIRAALIRIASDSALRDDLAERGRRRAAEFTWGNGARRLHDLYSRLLTQPR